MAVASLLKYRRNSKPVLTAINIGSQKPVFIKDEMFSPILRELNYCPTINTALQNINLPFSQKLAEHKIVGEINDFRHHPYPAHQKPIASFNLSFNAEPTNPETWLSFFNTPTFQPPAFYEFVYSIVLF
jgi:hypothetical protein